MKALTLIASLLLSATMFAQSIPTVYHAVAGTVHPYPAASVTLQLGSNPYTDLVIMEYGSGLHFLNYSLPDGTTARLDVTQGTKTTLPGYLTYQFDGVASGTDSAGVAVDVLITYKWHVVSGRYGGLRFISGSMSVTK